MAKFSFTLRKATLKLAHKAIDWAHARIVKEEAKLNAEAQALYAAATAAFQLAGEKSKEALNCKFHAQDVDRAKVTTVTK